MAVDLECERTVRCWEDLPDRDDLKKFNWKERTYFADTRIGRLVMAEVYRDRDTGQITETRETRVKFDRPVEFLTYDDVEAVYAICKETDCTIMEAVITHLGEDNLPDAWVLRALEAPPVRYRHSIPYEKATIKPIVKKTFVDPRKRKQKEDAQVAVPAA